MGIQTNKIELVKAILAIENNEIIQKVADFINKEKADFWNELSAAEQSEIKKGIEELNQGQRVSYDSKSNKFQGLYKCVVTKQTTFYYRVSVELKEIEIITIFDTRQNPNKLKKDFE